MTEPEVSISQALPQPLPFLKLLLLGVFSSSIKNELDSSFLECITNCILRTDPKFSEHIKDT